MMKREKFLKFLSDIWCSIFRYRNLLSRSILLSLSLSLHLSWSVPHFLSLLLSLALLGQSELCIFISQVSHENLCQQWQHPHGHTCTPKCTPTHAHSHTTAQPYTHWTDIFGSHFLSILGCACCSCAYRHTPQILHLPQTHTQTLYICQLHMYATPCPALPIPLPQFVALSPLLCCCILQPTWPTILHIHFMKFQIYSMSRVPHGLTRLQAAAVPPTYTCRCPGR